MPQHIVKGIADLLAEAEAVVTAVTPEEAREMAARGDLLVDLRDPRERQREGTIAGAFSCPRGMLEFWIDPASPYHKPAFAEDRGFVFFCASGWRSALAAQRAQEMGLAPVAHVKGGFGAWRDGGNPVEPPAPRD